MADQSRPFAMMASPSPAERDLNVRWNALQFALLMRADPNGGSRWEEVDDYVAAAAAIYEFATNSKAPNAQPEYRVPTGLSDLMVIE